MLNAYLLVIVVYKMILFVSCVLYVDLKIVFISIFSLENEKLFAYLFCISPENNYHILQRQVKITTSPVKCLLRFWF